jgi:uncharacterized protein (DUF2062 family)
MRGLTRTALARWLERLLHIHDTPHRTAVAFALGVFIGFSPLLGLHTALGLVLAFAFGLNRVAVLVGVYVNLPWFLGPYYMVATLVGAAVLRRPLPHGLLNEFATLLDRWPTGELARIETLLTPLFWPYVLGSTLLAALAAAVAYYAALGFVLARRHRHSGTDQAR